MSRRRLEGSETIARLSDWTRGQTSSERLASQLLRIEGFEAIDPSHPLGGSDGLKDVICVRNNKAWIGAAYFPRGQQTFTTIKSKVLHDLKGITINKVNGFVFVANQELTLSQRNKLRNLSQTAEIDIYHLERVASVLDSPQSYGIRLEFLDIEMNMEEQLAFIATRDALIREMRQILGTIASYLQDPDLLKNLSPEQLRTNIPLSEIKEFKSILDSITGIEPYIASGYAFASTSRISGLQVPLAELREFANLLDRIAGFGFLTGSDFYGHIKKLQVPLAELKEYETTLDRIILKLEKKRKLESN